MLTASKVKLSGNEKKKKKERKKATLGTQATFFRGYIHVRKSHNGSYHGS